MIEELIEQRLALDARSGLKRKRGDRRHFDTRWMRRQPGRVFYGLDSVTVLAKRTKYVRPNPYFPYTPGELARIYLDRLCRKQLGEPRLSGRLSLSKRDKAMLAIPAPLHFDPKPSRDGEFVYLDIRAAYFEIFAGVPLNLAFDVETGSIGRPRPALIIPPRDRQWLRGERELRHALFGMMSSADMSWFKNGRPQRATFRGDLTAPDLHAYVMTRLRTIARTAVREFGCRMWLTDAGIFQRGEGHDSFQSWLLSTFGLRCSVKAQGAGHLYALGDYRIGRHASRMAHHDLRGLSNLGLTS